MTDGLHPSTGPDEAKELFVVENLQRALAERARDKDDTAGRVPSASAMASGPPPSAEFLTARTRYLVALEQTHKFEAGASSRAGAARTRRSTDRAAYAEALRQRDEARMAFHEAAVYY